MKVIKPSYKIESKIDGDEILRHLEQAIRVCYKSEDKIDDNSHKKIIKHILNLNHESTLEHHSLTVKFICNRGFTHEMVRHRLCSFSQESTRYCNYSKDKFGSELTFIEPTHWWSWPEDQKDIWLVAMGSAEKYYLGGINAGMRAQDARGMLPIDIKTEIVVTANLRQWRHVLRLRTANAAHPSMRQLMRLLLIDFKEAIPIIFDDINWD